MDEDFTEETSKSHWVKPATRGAVYGALFGLVLILLSVSIFGLGYLLAIIGLASVLGGAYAGVRLKASNVDEGIRAGCLGAILGGTLAIILIVLFLVYGSVTR